MGEELIGDPLDVRMFEATNWKLKEGREEGDLEEFKGLAQVIYRDEKHSEQQDSYKIILHKRFDFTS